MPAAPRGRTEQMPSRISRHSAERSSRSLQWRSRRRTHLALTSTNRSIEREKKEHWEMAELIRTKCPATARVSFRRRLSEQWRRRFAGRFSGHTSNDRRAFIGALVAGEVVSDEEGRTINPDTLIRPGTENGGGSAPPASSIGVVCRLRPWQTAVNAPEYTSVSDRSAQDVPVQRRVREYQRPQLLAD